MSNDQRAERHIERALAERLFKARLNKGVMLKHVAYKIGVSSTCVSLWESGENCPRSFERWNQWAHALGEPPIIRLEEE